MTFHVPNSRRIRQGEGASDDSDGNNGCFALKVHGLKLFAVASDGMGWEHVSVSLLKPRWASETPSWDHMCAVKDIFWDKDDVVMQLHPAESEYVNIHEGCLHLWRPIMPRDRIPTPPAFLVGPK